jgi:hypothetical protein
MIDPEWLGNVSFPIQGGRVTGLAGLGSENVVLSLVTDDGKEMVVRCPKRMLGFRESQAPRARGTAKL